MLARQLSPEEEWRKIHGWDEYSASSNGRIRHDSTGHLLAIPKGNKYLQCCLRRKDRRIATRRVHILVALAFLGPKPTPEHEVNHKNGNKLDNRPDNLEYVTSLENEFHAAGWLKARGNNHGARFKKLMVQLVDWFDSGEVQGTFGLAIAHGVQVSERFSRHAGAIWAMAHELTADARAKRDSQTDGQVNTK